MMKSLANLKARLEALPKVREGRQHEALYAEYLKKSTLAKKTFEKASNAVSYAAPVLPASGYTEALKTVKSSSNIAFRLRDKLDTEPGAIVDAGSEASFTRLFDNATSAMKSCQNAWETQLQAKIKDWQTIAEVVTKLGEGEGVKPMEAQAKKLNTAIDTLLEAKTNLPQTESNASKTQSYLKDLNDSVSQLGLDTPFGKFLQDAASPLGADLDAVQVSEVTKKITELNLAKVFRIHLSS